MIHGSGKVVRVELNPGCQDEVTIKAVPGFEMAEFSRLGNKIICGKKAGKSYLDEPMPNMFV